MTKRYILTGTPGSGKTSIIHFLKHLGYVVVYEAATDLIASQQQVGILEPWTFPSFIDQITRLQIERQLEADPTSKLQFFDRSPFCTYALSIYLKYPIPSVLQEEIQRIKELKIYEKQVFFIENLGFCEPSSARKIDFQEALRFEKIHEEVYRNFGYECIKIPPLSLEERVKLIELMISK